MAPSTGFEPVIGLLPFKDISVSHLEEIVDHMSVADRAPRSINYALAVIRQNFNYAKYKGVYSGPSPIEHIKMPKVDNKRRRFLTHEEAKIA
ncbi:hypothetical protein ACFL5K_01805 [Gemmatimonadota bacterium]